jgi:vancomycin resistance protein YoaR
MSDLTTSRRGASRRQRRRRILVRRVVALVVLGLVALVGVGFAFAGSPGVLPAGAAVGGVDVSGMPEADAIRLLESRSEKLLYRPVTFVAGDAKLVLSASQLGVRANWRQAVEAVSERGSGFGPLRGLRRLRLRLGGAEIQPSLAWYGSAVDYAVRTLARESGTRPVNARIAGRDGRFAVVAGRLGTGLDVDRAKEAVVHALAGLERASTVRLPIETRRPAVTAADLRAPLARARAAVSAPVRLVAGGSTVTIQPREMRELLRLPRGGGRAVSIGGRYAERWVAGLADRVSRAPSDADWEVADGGRVRVTPAVPGLRLDIPATVERLEKAAFAAGGKRVATAALRVDEPSRTTAEAKDLDLREVVSSYTTTYGGTPGRLHNVQLVADLIDGALVGPGATFSFNGVTGERNASKGFEEAPVIINGELRNGIGGGVCQVSTTVFNAAFEAGLPITSRTNHALYIAHYPLGRDATVNYPDLDLRFVNDTKGWLLVRTRVGAGALTVQLLGTSPRRRVETETTPLEIIGKVPFEVVRDETLPRRTRIVEAYGTHPKQTSVRRRVYDAAGTLLSDRTWWSTYVGEPTIVRIGTRVPDPVVETPPVEAAVGPAPAKEAAPPSDEGTPAVTPSTPAPTPPPTPPPGVRP